MTTLTTIGFPFKTTHAGAARLERTATYLSRLLSKASSTIAASYGTWQAQRAAARADDAMWEFAHQDPRLMAEIQARLGEQAKKG